MDGLLSNISNFPKAKLAEERVQKLVWSGKRVYNKKLSDITGRNSIVTQQPAVIQPQNISFGYDNMCQLNDYTPEESV